MIAGPPARLPGLPSWPRLLLPGWLGLLHLPAALSRGRKLAVGLFAVFGVAFWVGIFFAAWWFFQRCVEVELVGPLLVRKVLDMTFLVFLSVLLFSNLIAAFSTFFLADALALVMALPLSTDSIYLARLTDTARHSSWMILIFGLPIFGAAGVVFDTAWTYYGLILAILPPFVLLPAVLGTFVTTMLVLVFPARRTRDLLLLLGLIGFCVLFVLFRLLRPERLLDESQFQDMVSLLAAFQTPQASWLPSSWAVRVLFPALRGEPAAGLADLGLLYLSAGAVLVGGTWAARATLRRAYSRSLEGSGQLGRRGGLTASRLAYSASPGRELLRKDLILFLRDPSQWSQLLLLLALVAVYVLNFKNFELLGASGIISALGLFYLNIGLTGFVMAAVGTRLIFPAISLEGRAFWLLQSAPLSASTFVRAKFQGGLLPIFALGLVTIAVTDWMIGTPWHLTVISVLTVGGLACLVAGMGVGLGALFPSFEAENATRIAAGFGGIVYMFLTMALIIGVLLLESWPVFLVHASLDAGRPLATRHLLTGGLSPVLAVAVTALATWLPLRLGSRSLARFGE